MQPFPNLTYSTFKLCDLSNLINPHATLYSLTYATSIFSDNLTYATSELCDLGVTTFGNPGPAQEQGTWYVVRGTRCMVHGAWYSTWYYGRGTVHGTLYLVVKNRAADGEFVRNEIDRIFRYSNFHRILWG